MCTKPNLIVSYRLPSNGYGENKCITKFYPNTLKREFDSDVMVDQSKYVSYRDIQGNLQEYFLEVFEKSSKIQELQKKLIRGEIEDLKINPVGCRLCKSCRRNKQKQDAARITMDCALQGFENSFFLTLTYNEFNLPSDGSLDKTEMQKFLKRLRRYEEETFGSSEIRYFLCGEYGPKNLRPHYHLIVSGLKLLDMKPFRANKLGQMLYRSETIEKLWTKGFSLIGECDYNTCAYVAGYVLKKAMGKKQRDSLREIGLEPEFTLQSLKPGLGLGHADSNDITQVMPLLDKIYSPVGCSDDGIPLYYDKVLLPSNGEKPNVARPPRYFDNLLKKYDPERADLVSQARAYQAEMAQLDQLQATDLNERQYFDAKHEKNEKNEQRGFLRDFLFEIS